MKTCRFLSVTLKDRFSALAVTKNTNIRITLLRLLLICMLTAMVNCQRSSSAQMYSHLIDTKQSSAELTIAANAPQNKGERANSDLPVPLTVIGYFTNVEHIDAHSYGYSVNLWRQEDTILGLISAHSGLSGDPPAGLLEDVKFDPQSTKPLCTESA